VPRTHARDAIRSVDMLGYLHSRSLRQESFKASTAERSIEPDSAEYKKELRSYLGRERVLLRKRRTKLKVDQFRIIAQVGQGGYGSVYLARKADTGEVCALKKMKKKTLAKMDEVRGSDTRQARAASLDRR
jgi:serine/threonine protein kinase